MDRSEAEKKRKIKSSEFLFRALKKLPEIIKAENLAAMDDSDLVLAMEAMDQASDILNDHLTNKKYFRNLVKTDSGIKH